MCIGGGCNHLFFLEQRLWIRKINHGTDLVYRPVEKVEWYLPLPLRIVGFVFHFLWWGGWCIRSFFNIGASIGAVVSDLYDLQKGMQIY